MKKMIMIFAGLIISIIAIYFLYNACRIQKRSSFGTDIHMIEDRFENISNIQRCYYRATLTGRNTIGPSNYKLEAVILVDEQYAEKIQKQYDWEQVQLKVEENFLAELQIEGTAVWEHNQIFQEDILNHKFVGKVYFSSEKRIIYLQVENL